MDDMPMKRTLNVVLSRYRSELLTCALVALMLASPLDDRSPHLGGLLALLQFLLLIVGANYIADRKMVRSVALPLAGVWLVARLFEAFGDPPSIYSHLAPIAGLMLSCAVLWVLLNRFGTISNVTGSAISEAIITYLVIAIAFAQLYWALDQLLVRVFDKQIPSGQSSAFLYFSTITLSGLGYSNIYPINPCVRLIAALENITGVFYIAIVVSRLVSSYRNRVERREQRKVQRINDLISAACLAHDSSSEDNDSPLEIRITHNQIQIHFDQPGLIHAGTGNGSYTN